MKRKILKYGLILFGLIVTLCATAIFVLYLKGFFAWPDFSRLNDRRATSVFVDERGERIREVCTFCRELATLDELGEFPRLAVAAEDKDFWTRWTPYDWKGVARAVWQTLQKQKVHQGASDITQQAARNLFLETELKHEWETDSFEASLWRKGREAWTSALFERTYERKKILEAYLNVVYCGRGLHGIKTCSRYWWNKEPTELNIAEAALIIGFWRKPGLASIENKNEVFKLRERVLQQFVDEKIISYSQKDEFNRYPLPRNKEPDPCRAIHASEWARLKVTEKRRLADEGLTVHLTINCEWQRTASRALQESVEAMKTRNPELTDLRAVAVVLDNHSGRIKVLTQEPSFHESEYRMDQILRQVGSAAKPFFYAKWVENGGRLSCEDEGLGPCKLDDSYDIGDGSSAIYISWNEIKDGNFRRVQKHIQNFPYEGSMARYIGMAEPIRCMAESRNVCTMSGVRGIKNSRAPRLVAKEEMLELLVRLGVRLHTAEQKTGEQEKISVISPKIAKKFGFPKNVIDPGLTLPIGSIEISSIDMARALAGIINGVVEPFVIEEISDMEGKSLYQTEISEPKKVLDAKVSLAMIRGLRSTIEFPHGTGQLAKNGKWDEENKTWIIPKLDFQVLGKTGTANSKFGDSIETTDNWFIGCTPSYCMAVWIGREKKLPMKTTMVEHPDGRKEKIQETGGRNALPVFIKTFAKIYETHPKETFPEATDPFKPFQYRIESKEENIQEPMKSEGNDF